MEELKKIWDDHKIAFKVEGKIQYLLDYNNFKAIIEQNFVSKSEVENMKDLFWSMLQNLEARTNPEEDILDKIEVESVYKVWNKVYHTNVKPRWINGGN